MWTLEALAAGSATYGAHHASSVQEEHGLLLLCEAVLHQFLQAHGEDGSVARLEFRAKVYDLALRKASISDTVRHAKHDIFATFCSAIGFNGRCRRT